MVTRDLTLHTAPLDRDFEEQLRIDTQRARRRSFVILAGFAGFLASLCFSKDPDDTLQLAIALVFSFITVRLIPDRWFGRDRSEALHPTPSHERTPACASLTTAACAGQAKPRSLTPAGSSAAAVAAVSTTTLTLALTLTRPCAAAPAGRSPDRIPTCRNARCAPRASAFRQRLSEQAIAGPGRTGHSPTSLPRQLTVPNTRP